MDINDVLDGTSENTTDGNLIITGEIREYLKEAAKWAKFMAIVGFVFMGLQALGMLLGVANIAMILMMAEGFGALIIIFFLVAYIISFMILLYLYRFANDTQRAIQIDDQSYLRTAFENLKSYFKTLGILTAIAVGIYVLILLFVVIIGVGAAL